MVTLGVQAGMVVTSEMVARGALAEMVTLEVMVALEVTVETMVAAVLCLCSPLPALLHQLRGKRVCRAGRRFVDSRLSSTKR